MSIVESLFPFPSLLADYQPIQCSPIAVGQEKGTHLCVPRQLAQSQSSLLHQDRAQSVQEMPHWQPMLMAVDLYRQYTCS